MNDTFGKDCLKRFWVKCKAVMSDEMQGRSRTLDFILDSVPDLSKRSIWALKALTYTSEPGMWPEFSVTATDAYLTITSFFKSLIKWLLSFIERTQLSIILLDSHLFIWSHVYKKDDIESWSPGVRQVKWNEAAQSCLTLCDPMDCSLPGSSVHWIFQARVLEWVAISFSRGFSWPRDRTWVSLIAGRCFTIWATRGQASRIQISYHCDY